MFPVLAVFLKEWRSEWRARAALNSAVLFAVLAPVALSFSLAGANLAENKKNGPLLMGGLLWSVLLFSALSGLPRTFVREEEAGTVWLLRLSCGAESVLWGKALFNVSLLALTQAVAVPLFEVMLGAKVAQPGLLLLVLLLGDLGLATASTFLGAVAAQSRARGALFPALAVPGLLPLLVACSALSGNAFGSESPVSGALSVLIAYDVIIVTLSWMLWQWVWD